MLEFGVKHFSKLRTSPVKYSRVLHYNLCASDYARPIVIRGAIQSTIRGVIQGAIQGAIQGVIHGAIEIPFCKSLSYFEYNHYVL